MRHRPHAPGTGEAQTASKEKHRTQGNSKNVSRVSTLSPERNHTHHRILHYRQINICSVVKKYDLFNQWKPYEAEKAFGSQKCLHHVKVM